MLALWRGFGSPSCHSKDDLVVTVVLNSQPSNDHIGELMAKLYAIFAK